ncbi:FAD-dependent monooxygenase [Streptomyces sp. NPDC051162]|uniref:FAD-dependent monooxygenase n=1 Tax=unclassified Streptomyces TaxID=2593676 RepID=UPI00342F3297
MQAGTLDTFATRGLAERFIERGTPVPTGHFGAATTRLDFSTVGAVHPFMLALGQSVTEQLLEEHAVSVGARVLRGEEVVSLAQGPDAVEVVIRAGGTHRTVQARWVVGCDGTRSAVRQAAGIDFPGQDTTLTGWLADVEVGPPDRRLRRPAPRRHRTRRAPAERHPPGRPGPGHGTGTHRPPPDAPRPAIAAGPRRDADAVPRE